MNVLTRLKNPFKGRQPGAQVARPKKIKPPYPQYNWEDCITALQHNNAMTDEDFAAVMGLNIRLAGFDATQNPIVQNYRSAAEQEARRRQLVSQAQPQVPIPQSGPTTGPLQNPIVPVTPDTSMGVHAVQHGDLTLVTFSPEELLRKVEERRSRVSFDLSKTAKFMDNYNQVWSWMGPIIFALGTIGEIFLVLWERQKHQDWFTAGTIVAVSMIAEGTLLAISFTSKRLRNRADKRSTGWTDKERKKLDTLKKFWFALAVGVAATQVAFVVAQTNPGDIGTGAVWIIAIVRSIAALVADAYTAFVSEEKPTTGELAIEQQDQETQFAKKILEQTAIEVETINTGAIKVQEVGVEAEMKQDRMNTQKELAKMQNQAQIESMRQEQKQKVLIDRMRNSAMQAIFDPEMPHEQRQAIIQMLTGLMGATRDLPAPGETTIDDGEV